jgi:O-antigen ligase
MITAIAFSILFATGIALCIWRHPVYGLYTYIAVFYLHPPSRWWAAELPDLRWSFVAAGVTLFVTLLRRHDPTRPRWGSFTVTRLFLVYLGWMWVQTLWVVDRDVHLDGLILFTKYAVVVYLIYELLDTRERLIQFFAVHAAGCLYLGFLAYTSVYADRLDGVGGPGLDDASSLGAQLAAGAFAGACLYFAAGSPLRWLGVLTVPLALNGVAMAASRGSFVALVVGGWALYWFGAPRRRLMLMGYGILGIGLFLYLTPPEFWERMSTILQSISEDITDHSVETRKALLPAQWQMFLDHPLGAGYDATTTLSTQYLDTEYMSGAGQRSSHNTLMSALVDQGVVGIVVWVWLAVAVMRDLVRCARKCKRNKDEQLAWLVAAVGSTFVTIFAAGMFAPFIAKEIYFWCLGLACSAGSLTWGVRELVARNRAPSARSSVSPQQ